MSGGFLFFCVFVLFVCYLLLASWPCGRLRFCRDVFSNLCIIFITVLFYLFISMLEFCSLVFDWCLRLVSTLRSSEFDLVWFDLILSCFTLIFVCVWVVSWILLPFVFITMFSCWCCGRWDLSSSPFSYFSMFDPRIFFWLPLRFCLFLLSPSPLFL